MAFHRLLNRFCYDLSDAIIVTWNLASGVQDGRCVRCYFAALDTIARVRVDYEREFGVVPLGRVRLRGREQPIDLFGLRRIGDHG